MESRESRDSGAEVRKPRRRVLLEDILREPYGGAIRVSDLAIMTGFSKKTLHLEIERGRLKAVQLLWRGCWWIQRPDAIAYLAARQFISRAS